jgi:hypothetical protein
VRRFTNRRAGLAIGAIVVLVATGLVLVFRDGKLPPKQQARLVLRNVADRQRHGCADRPPTFRIYTLGARFLGEFASESFGDRCDYDGDGVTITYGPCDDVGESGCNYTYEVSSQPVCLRPRALARTFSTVLPHGDSGPATVTTLRGVPAVMYKRDTIVLMTRDTLITISANAKPARQAVDALNPAAGPSASTLPKPDASVIGGKLRNRQCPT